MSNQQPEMRKPVSQKRPGKAAAAGKWFAAQSGYCKVMMALSALMLIVSITIWAVVGVGAAVRVVSDVLARPQQQEQPPVDDNPPQQEDPVLPPETLDPAILPEGEDAGSAYLKDTLFIGDSNYARLVAYDLLDLQQVIGVEGMGIGSVVSEKCVYFTDRDPVTIPAAVKLLQPRRIVMNFGTNNLLPKSTENFIKNYRSAIEAIQKSYPYADIIIQSIPPLGENRENAAMNMTAVDEYNAALLELCGEMELRFLNVTDDVFKDAETGWAKKGIVISDGIHLVESALKNLLTYVRTHPLESEDTRPALTKIPTRKPAPRPVEPEFDMKKVAEEAMKLFSGKEYIAFTGKETEAERKTAKTYTYTVNPEAEAGDESQYAASLVNYVDPQVAIKTGSKVEITYKKDNKLGYVFTVLVLQPCTHEYNDWVVTKPATATEAGMRTQTCKKCGLVVEEEIPKLVDPETCTHEFGDWVVTKPATETAAGERTRTCKLCSKEEKEVIQPTKPNPETCTHQFSAWQVTKPATATEAGEQTRKCSLCGKEEKQTIQPTKPNPETCTHQFSAWQVTKPATETAAGEQTRKCSLCGKEEKQTIQPTGPVAPPSGGDGGGSSEGGGNSGGNNGSSTPTPPTSGEVPPAEGGNPPAA